MSLLYTFHSYGPDGNPVAMQTAAFPSDATATRYAGQVLTEHLSAAWVLVCDGERQVAVRHRTAGGGALVPPH